LSSQPLAGIRWIAAYPLSSTSGTDQTQGAIHMKAGSPGERYQYAMPENYFQIFLEMLDGAQTGNGEAGNLVPS
jgi:hypothetical protein